MEVIVTVTEAEGEEGRARVHGAAWGHTGQCAAGTVPTTLPWLCHDQHWHHAPGAWPRRAAEGKWVGEGVVEGRGNVGGVLGHQTYRWYRQEGQGERKGRGVKGDACHHGGHDAAGSSGEGATTAAAGERPPRCTGHQGAGVHQGGPSGYC